jgi:sortase B
LSENQGRARRSQRYAQTPDRVSEAAQSTAENGQNRNPSRRPVSNEWEAYARQQLAEGHYQYDEAADKYTGEGSKVPITVDFKKLQKENPDVVGWIYCEGTEINYPVLQGKDNDQYLHTDYKGDYNIDGSIFVDADNTPGFTDSNTIIYGHHMNSGAMFAGLVNWADQEYYEKHPIIWLLTPEKNYKIVLFSGHHVPSSSSMYDIIKTPGKEMNTFLSEALEMSDFTTDVKLNPNARYVMLSTCAYLFDGDRYVLHGVLVTVQ